MSLYLLKSFLGKYKYQRLIENKSQALNVRCSKGTLRIEKQYVFSKAVKSMKKLSAREKGPLPPLQKKHSTRYNYERNYFEKQLKLFGVEIMK